MVRSADSTNEVTVLFEGASLMFTLPRGATLEELATRIAFIEERQFGEPVSIDIKLRH